jgi:hypothetical protein
VDTFRRNATNCRESHESGVDHGAKGMLICQLLKYLYAFLHLYFAAPGADAIEAAALFADNQPALVFTGLQRGQIINCMVEQPSKIMFSACSSPSRTNLLQSFLTVT